MEWERGGGAADAMAPISPATLGSGPNGLCSFGSEEGPTGPGVAAPVGVTVVTAGVIAAVVGVGVAPVKNPDRIETPGTNTAITIKNNNTIEVEFLSVTEK